MLSDIDTQIFVALIAPLYAPFGHKDSIILGPDKFSGVPSSQEPIYDWYERLFTIEQEKIGVIRVSG